MLVIMIDAAINENVMLIVSNVFFESVGRHVPDCHDSTMLCRPLMSFRLSRSDVIAGRIS